MALTTADEPSADRITDVSPIPIAAKATAPSRSASTSEKTGREGGVEPEARDRDEHDRLEREDEQRRAEHRRRSTDRGGSGVARRRLRIPDSRRIVSVIARPANDVATTP